MKETTLEKRSRQTPCAPKRSVNINILPTKFLDVSVLVQDD